MREFYCDYLGFEITFEHRFAPDLPLYCGLKRGDCLLHLSEHHGDCTPGSGIRIEVPYLAAFHAALPPDNPNARPEITERPWAREVVLMDPFGNRLTFWEAL